MAQYCRYCSNMSCGDANYCVVKKICKSDEQIKRTNKCKSFDFNPIDSLQENTNGYKPVQRKTTKESFEQIEISELCKRIGL